jgi:hypothetical protein
MSSLGTGSTHFHFPAGGILPNPIVTSTDFNAAQRSMILNQHAGGKQTQKNLAKSKKSTRRRIKKSGRRRNGKKRRTNRRR